MSQEVFIVNLVMHTGTDFTQTYVLEDTASNSEKELNGFSACAQMRRYETSSVAAVFSTNFKDGGRIEYKNGGIARGCGKVMSNRRKITKVY